MTIIKIGDFPSRDALERAVEDKAGRTPEVKPDFQIVGTRKELARFFLDENCRIWGVSCVVLEKVKKKEDSAKFGKVERGEIKPFGINNNLKIRKK